MCACMKIIGNVVLLGASYIVVIIFSVQPEVINDIHQVDHSILTPTKEHHRMRSEKNSNKIGKDDEHEWLLMWKKTSMTS